MDQTYARSSITTACVNVHIAHASSDNLLS